MDTILNWGVELIIIIQKIRTVFLDHFFKAVSALGTDFFYMLVLPLLYWCVEKRHALRLFYLLMFSSWLNSVSKDAMKQPRPYHLDPTVKVGHTGGPGLPSGHAQGSLVVWGFLALWVRKRWFTFFCIFIIMIIAFSRMYLGVHFPTDILGGWLLGLLLLLPFHALADRIEAKVSGLSMTWKILLGTAVPLLLITIIPSKWSVSPMAITAGFTLAILLEERYVGAAMPGGWKHIIERYLLGIAGMFLIFFASKKLIIKDSVYFLAMVFVQYYIMGLWVGLGAPWLFKILGLEAKENPTMQEGDGS